MHYMHYKDYIHHGLAAEKTPPPLPQGGGTIWLGGGGVWGSLLIYIYICMCICVRETFRYYVAPLVCDSSGGSNRILSIPQRALEDSKD